ncbi:hypothetical protein EPUL_006423, partial [Erysiphe pulchra]
MDIENLLNGEEQGAKIRKKELVKHEGNEPLWIWKDGKGGYEELLGKVAEPIRKKLMSFQINKIGKDTIEEIEENLQSNLNEIKGVKKGASDEKYLNSSWYGEISGYLKDKVFESGRVTKVQKEALIRKARNFIIEGDDLYRIERGRRKRCVLEDEVAGILMMAHAHDQGGHFSQAITLRKLKDYYWPRMTVDARDYIQGCLVCAKFGTALRSQSSARVKVSEPMELLGLDFVGPFPDFPGVSKKWILVAVDYFSRYTWAEATNRNDSETVIKFLKDKIFEKFGVPVGFYTDPGTHFGKKTRRFAESYGTIWCNSPVAAKRAVGMVEKTIDILQRVLKKMTVDPKEWSNNVERATLEVNRREIPHLMHSPSQIFLGFNPSGPLEVNYPTEKRKSLTSALKIDVSSVVLEDDEHSNKVIEFLANRMHVYDEVLERSELRKEMIASKYDSGVISQRSYNPGDMVMLFDHQQAGKKLRPSWRGPFVVKGFGGDMGRSYTLRQIDGTSISRHYHGDSLKRFRLREGYLVTGEEESLPVYQNIRLGRATFKLPKDLRTVPGALVPNV